MVKNWTNLAENPRKKKLDPAGFMGFAFSNSGLETGYRGIKEDFRLKVSFTQDGTFNNKKNIKK